MQIQRQTDLLSPPSPHCDGRIQQPRPKFVYNLSVCFTQEGNLMRTQLCRRWFLCGPNHVVCFRRYDRTFFLNLFTCNRSILFSHFSFFKIPYGSYQIPELFSARHLPAVEPALNSETQAVFVMGVLYAVCKASTLLLSLLSSGTSALFEAGALWNHFTLMSTMFYSNLHTIQDIPVV